MSYLEFVIKILKVGKVGHVLPHNRSYLNLNDYDIKLEEFNEDKVLAIFDKGNVEHLSLWWEHTVSFESTMWGSRKKEKYKIEKNDILDDALTEVVPAIPMLLYRKLLKTVKIDKSERSLHDYGSRTTLKCRYINLFDLYNFLHDHELI